MPAPLVEIDIVDNEPLWGNCQAIIYTVVFGEVEE
jgi:hypothetical protein